MIGAWPPTIKKEYFDTGYNFPEPTKSNPKLCPTLLTEFEETYSELVNRCLSLESRIRELEALLETLSPGVTRG